MNMIRASDVLIPLIQFPVPPRLIHELGYAGDRQLVAVYRHPRHGVRLFDGCANQRATHGVWEMFWNHPALHGFWPLLAIGSTYYEAELLLIIDTVRDRAYLSDIKNGRQLLSQQWEEDEIQDWLDRQVEPRHEVSGIRINREAAAAHERALNVAEWLDGWGAKRGKKTIYRLDLKA